MTTKDQTSAEAAFEVLDLLPKKADEKPFYKALERVIAAARAESCVEANELLREAVKGWEPGPGPFEVPLPVVNKIINYLGTQR